MVILPFSQNWQNGGIFIGLNQDNYVKLVVGYNGGTGLQLAHETNMKLLREPRPFNLHTSRHIMRLMGHSDSKWRKYLFY